MTINVFMAPDLTTEMQPLLDAMKNALEGKIQTTGQATQTALTSVKAEVSGVAADVAEVQTDVESLTTVNGQISTEVQAINTHTDETVAASRAAVNQHVDSALNAQRDIPVRLNSMMVSGKFTITGRGRILSMYYRDDPYGNRGPNLFYDMIVDGVNIGSPSAYHIGGMKNGTYSIPFNKSFSSESNGGSKGVVYELYE